jgi:PRTRC genetic system protein A
MKPVGYHIASFEPWGGPRGPFYDYILAGDGLWIEAENRLLLARVPVATAEVRGLPPFGSLLKLAHGLIPARLFDLAFNVMLASPRREVYVAVVWDGEQYSLRVPEQKGKAAGVRFDEPDNVILDLHSHPGMPARFSGTDDRDEQGLRLYGVVGRGPALSLRIGVYGYFMEVAPDIIFEGTLSGIRSGEEVIDEEMVDVTIQAAQD